MSRYFITSTIFLVITIASLIMDGLVEIQLWWYIVLIAVYVLITTVGSIVLSLQFFIPVISCAPTGGVALSFDDGPVPGKTEKILDILRAHDVPAAFFCIGKRVSESPLLLRRIDDEGHLIGNHSFYHRPTFDLQSSTMIAKELADTDAAVGKIIGKKLKFFRPPYGVTNPMVAKATKRLNYKVIGWSVRSFDTVIKNPDKLLRRVTRRLKDGDIILLHDHCDVTITILPRLLEYIRKSGLKVVRVDELIKERAYV